MLKKHEGLRLKPYKDTVGKWTIGYGRNLDDVGISKKEAEYLLKNDIGKVKRNLKGIGWYEKLNNPRKSVIENMAFNLGYRGLMMFQRMIKAIKSDNYDKAANEMMDSKWANQVGYRAKELSKIMRSGSFG